jgi:hypothetical protein
MRKVFMSKQNADMVFRFEKKGNGTSQTNMGELMGSMFGLGGDEVILGNERDQEVYENSVTSVFKSGNFVIHIENMETIRRNPNIARKMAHIYGNLKRKFPGKNILQILSVSIDVGESIPDTFRLGNLTLKYQVVKMWEREPEGLLESEGLLPMAALCRDNGDGEKLLERIAARITQIKDEEVRKERIEQTRVFALLRYPEEMVDRILPTQT